MSARERTGPVVLTHPARLRAQAFVHGLCEPSLGAFRLLDLACADGGNVLPMAARFPEAEFVGVDNDIERLSAARSDAEACGIDNISFVERGAFDVAAGDSFDFVIAHGVYSWIEAEAQRALLATAAAALAPTGVACVSYNTLPGWSLRGVIRSAMLAAARGKSGADRLTAARSRLAKLRRHLPGGQHPYTAMLAAELELAHGKTDAELCDDHLAEHNEALYVEQFLDRAAEHQLAFLCELVPASPDGALELELPDKLMQDGLSRIEAEQCLDLLCYRQLRATLLCREEAARFARPDLSRLRDTGYFAGRVLPKAEEPLLGPGKTLQFETPAGVVIEADRPLLKASLSALGEAWPIGLKAQAIVSDAIDRLRVRGLLEDEGVATAEIDETVSDLVELCCRGQLELWSWTPTVHREIAERPQVFPLTRLEAEQADFVTSPRHEPLRLDEFARTMVRLLDGTRDYNALVSEIGNRIDGGALSVDADMPFADRNEAIAALVMRSVVTIRDLGLLAPAAEGQMTAQGSAPMSGRGPSK